jgi:hypothetical protein
MGKPYRLKPFHFTQYWGTYANQTLVMVNVEPKDVPKRVASLKLVSDENMELLMEMAQTASEEEGNGNKGMFVFNDEHALSMLVLNDFDFSWKNWDTLMHECHHAVHIMLGEKRCMSSEREALAYAQQFLVSEIRRTICREEDRQKAKAKKPKR